MGAYGNIDLASWAASVGAKPQTNADGVTTFVLPNGGTAVNQQVGGAIVLGADGKPTVLGSGYFGPDGNLAPQFVNGGGGVPGGANAQTGGAGGGNANNDGRGGSGGAPNTSGGTPAQQDAQSIIQGLLDQYGLGSEASWAWGLVTQGATPAMIELQLRQRPAFQARFPGIALRENAGLPPISPGQYIAYEDQVQQSMRAAGIPPGFYDSPAEIGGLIGQDVSAAEVDARIQKGFLAASQADQTVKQTLSNYYGIDQGHLAAYYLDPAKALPLLERQMQAAQVGAAGVQSGYGDVGSATAEELAAQGVSAAAARQGFSQLENLRQVFNPLPGQAGTAVDQSTQLAATFEQNADAQRLVQNAEDAQTSMFKGGGAFGSSQTGISGVGANRQ
jgi:hypothetical protein